MRVEPIYLDKFGNFGGNMMQMYTRTELQRYWDENQKCDESLTDCRSFQEWLDLSLKECNGFIEVS